MPALGIILPSTFSSSILLILAASTSLDFLISDISFRIDIAANNLAARLLCDAKLAILSKDKKFRVLDRDWALSIAFSDTTEDKSAINSRLDGFNIYILLVVKKNQKPYQA